MSIKDVGTAAEPARVTGRNLFALQRLQLLERVARGLVAPWSSSPTPRHRARCAAAAFASQLIKGALDLIRRDGREVIAGCGFVVNYLDKHLEDADLVA